MSTELWALVLMPCPNKELAWSPNALKANHLSMPYWPMNNVDIHIYTLSHPHSGRKYIWVSNKGWNSNTHMNGGFMSSHGIGWCLEQPGGHWCHKGWETRYFPTKVKWGSATSLFILPLEKWARSRGEEMADKPLDDLPATRYPPSDKFRSSRPTFPG